MINLAELKETLNLNKDIIKNNRMLTNEILVDDIMVSLGYNKKRDTSVKRLYSGAVDWEVLSPTGSRIAVKVFAFGEEINSEELNSAIEFCTDKRFSIFMIIHGDIIIINRFNKETREYKEVYKFSLSEDLDNTANTILNAISKDGFNLEVIDNMKVNSIITSDDVMSILIESVDSIVDIVLDSIGDTNDEVKIQCKEIITNLINKKEISSDSNVTNEIDKAEIERLETENKELNGIIESLRETIKDYQKQINNIENSDSSSANSSSASSDEIHSYREQIQKLTSELAIATERVSELEDNLEKAQNEIDNMSGVDRIRAQELLAVIEDNPELERHYVGVINTELIQFDELHTFIGRSLQKLYEIKSFEASQFIFNGDIFRLIQPAVRNDLIMNNKAYDIDIADAHEDDVLNKIRIVFSHFNDVIFECKKIGTLKRDVQITENLEDVEQTFDETEDDINEDFDKADVGIDDTSEEIDGSFSDSTFEDEFETSGTFEKISESTEFNLSDGEVDEISMDDSFENDEEASFGVNLNKNQGEVDNEIFGTDDSFNEGFDTGVSEEDTWEVEQPNGESLEFNNEDFDELDEFNSSELNYNGNAFDNISVEDNTYGMQSELLVAQMLQLDQLIWSDEQVRFNTIKYIGDNSVTFNINMNCEDMTHEQLLCKCIDAVLAVEALKGNTGAISLLKQKDFSLVNNFLKLFTEEYQGYPRINGTKYAIVGVESVQQVASILYDICDSMQIDMSELFIYFDATTPSEFLSSNYGYPEDAVQLKEYYDFDREAEIQETIAIIKGDIFNNIVVTKNSLTAHKDIIIKPLAIKTKYLAKVLTSINDVIEVVEQMLVEASKLTPNLNLQSLGNVVGENYRLLSDNENEVGENPLTLDYQGMTLYMANVEPWQILHSLIKLHTTLFGNTAIAIKMTVNVNAINFYGKHFETSEPSYSLAVRSFVDYVAINIKK